jgi:hypothetical protein
MRRHWLIGLLAALLGSVFLIAPKISWATAGCSDDVELGQAGSECVKSGGETNAYLAQHSGHTYVIRPACDIGGAALCQVPGSCNIGGHEGSLYNVYEDNLPEPLDWQACLTDQEAQRLGGLTPGAVQHAFERLAWPASPLIVQPPRGRTLVDFDTNFYTTNTRPSTQTVTLIGQPVTIEATPTEYHWHFGSGATDDDLTTTDPGAAYPDLRVTYRYLHVGPVRPSLDTTYAGRYRVAGGPWRTIPDTLTVLGPPVDLQVLSATPHLVGY